MNRKEYKAKQKQFIFNIANILKQEIEDFNTNYDINMLLFRPGIEPLNVIDKSVIDIIEELKSSIIVMLTKLYKTKTLPLHNYSYQKLFGMERDELLKLSGRINILNSVIDYSKQDEELFGTDFVSAAGAFVDDELSILCYNMLHGYACEIRVLKNDFENFSITTTEENGNISSTITSPQTCSDLIRIMYKDNSYCYCTIADAIQDNQGPKKRIN